MTVELPDVEGAVRSYLRSHSDVQAVVGQRVWFGRPDNPTWPLVLVARVGGFDELGDAPVDQALLQIDCEGALHTGTRNAPDKAGANAVRLAVRQALYELREPVDVELDDDNHVRLAGAVIQSDPYIEDPGDRRPRYPITVQITALKLNPVP